MERRPGTNPLAETRRESHEKVDKKTQYLQIIEILQSSNESLSAREISEKRYEKGWCLTPSRQETAPRTSELLRKGILENDGKKYDAFSERDVGTFKLRKGVNVYELI